MPKISAKFDRSHPLRGHQMQVGGSKSATFISDGTVFGRLSCLCRVRFGAVNWIPDNSRLSPTKSLKSGHVSVKQGHAFENPATVTTQCVHTAQKNSLLIRNKEEGITGGRNTLNTLVAIVQFAPPCQTRHRQDRFVVSGVAV